MGLSETNLIVGAQKYLAMCDESQFGVFPGSPSYYHIPVTDYNVKFKPVNRQANPYTGIFQRMHSQNFKGMPSGTMSLPLYGCYAPNMGTSVAQYFLNWAFGSYETMALPSKSIEWYEGPNVANKRHLGVRVNSATLTGSSDAGNISLSLDLMAQAEVGQSVVTSAQTLPTNRYKLLDFEYCSGPQPDCAIYLGTNGGENSLDLIYPESFSLQIQNGLKPEYLNSFSPMIMPKTQRVVTLSVVLPKNSDTYDNYSRLTTETELIFGAVFQGLHDGTGPGGTSWTTVQIDAKRVAFLEPADGGAKEDLTKQTLNFVVLKPPTSDTDLEFTYGAE